MFKICAGLVEIRENEILIIDEPELSLHPQAQKKLASVIREFSGGQQIIVITHSPYFVNWVDLKGGAAVIRLVKENDKECLVYHLNNQADYYEKLFKFSEEWQRPQLLDVVAKELFFSENILFVEGQEDVGLLNKFIREMKLPVTFDIFGYGVGGAGNIMHLLEMGKDLGIKTAAVYDGDKKVDADKAKLKFPKSFIVELPEGDIRDKHKRDPNDSKKELPEIEKAGLFDKDGNIKNKYEGYLSDLLLKIETYFNG